MVKKTPANSTAFLARSVGYVGRVVHVPGHKLGKSRPGIPGIRGYHGDRVVGLQIAAFSLILTTSKSWDPPSTMGHYRTPTPNAIFFEGNQRTFIVYLHQLWCPLKMGNRWPKIFLHQKHFSPDEFYNRMRTHQKTLHQFFSKSFYTRKKLTRGTLYNITLLAGNQPGTANLSDPTTPIQAKKFVPMFAPPIFEVRTPTKLGKQESSRSLSDTTQNASDFFPPTISFRPLKCLLQNSCRHQLQASLYQIKRVALAKDARLIPGRRKSPASVHWNKPTIQTSWRFLSWD